MERNLPVHSIGDAQGLYTDNWSGPAGAHPRGAVLCALRCGRNSATLTGLAGLGWGLGRTLALTAPEGLLTGE